MLQYEAGTTDVIVIGAGHAGCEAGLACSRLGMSVLMLSINLDAVAMMACNPSIGGTSKGHLVREIDALGGEMGLAADDTLLQSKMLNTGKGPAVHSLRAQADKRAYQMRMKRTLERQQGLFLRQGEAASILTHAGRVQGVVCATGAVYRCRALIVATGVYLDSRVIIGEYSRSSGPSGMQPAQHLSNSLRELGFELRRFKTGTPARVNMRSLDLSKMEIQHGDDIVIPFSFMNSKGKRQQYPCYLTYTNNGTHEIIRQNLHRSPMYSGAIKGTGARYCPSIEDKVVRFADKDRHQLFLEPEGLSTDEMYVQGMSSSMPEDVQLEMMRSVAGMERVEVMRSAYAIEYDCIDPVALHHSLQSREVDGLFFAGQINGSSGYEEAAAQGLLAGINACLYLQDRPPLVLRRSEAYIGVLIDDLVTKGTNEPYRMMTSRAEYRLLLRQDNADFRLTEMGREVGLVSDERFERMTKKAQGFALTYEYLLSHRPKPGALQTLLESRNETPPANGIYLWELLKRSGVTYQNLHALDASLPDIAEDVAEQLETTAKYEGYIRKQQQQVEQFALLENKRLPDGWDYGAIGGLRIEARQKLQAQRPENIGQASRIPGVTPADIAVLLVALEKHRREKP